MEEDEIAIVGAGCRFPGADNLDEFWEVLVNGENHVREIPESRWNNKAFYDVDPNAPGKSYVKKAGLLKDHDKFDYRLFGISEVEAARMDPQQRYVLECVHMAMEDGGFTRKEMSGTNAGVIIGCMNADYRGMANYDLTDVGGYNATGSAVSVISARVSYVYNLHGTCLTLDTACSSALIAIHLASQAIRTGDCDMMICGGVSSILSPDNYIPLCKAHMMSATGQCQSFCETADGYARGEGCGIVILKSLKAARRDGNKIWATIKTGSNQDGCTAKPMTAPSGDQQLKLLEEVYKKCNFEPSDIQYIEAHGTGTPRGDPTELNALGEFFSSSGEARSRTLLVGSVKSNIGHTESAAGIAGLLKVLLMMNHGQFVPTLHINPDKSNLNRKIKLSEYGLDIPTSVMQWFYNGNNERHACLNSFGFGGSNTHAIISMEKSFLPKSAVLERDRFLPICISGADQDALKLNLIQFHDDLDNMEIIHPDMAMISLRCRDIFTYRTLIYGNDKKAVQSECKRKADKVSGISQKKKRNIVFVFCGVGTTWTGMCVELMKYSKVFRRKIAEIDTFLKLLVGWKISDKFNTDTTYDDPFLNHIAIFCVQVALVEMWKSFGIIPDNIIGQSVGEVAAAYTAQYLTLEEAVTVIFYRSLILSRQSQGSMTVVGNVDINHIEEICYTFNNKVSVAVYSSPTACTLSGSKDDLKLFKENLKSNVTNKDLFVRELNVKCAYHSSFLEGCMDEIETKIDSTLNSIKTGNPQRIDSIQLISTVTGEIASQEQLRTGKYWAQNIRQPVRFMQSIKKAYDDKTHNVYLELGPRPVLRAHIENIFEINDKVVTIPSMIVKKEIETLHTSLSSLFEMGIDVHTAYIQPDRKIEKIRIPRYSFNKTGTLFISNTCKDYIMGASTYSIRHLFVQTSRGANETTFKILLDEESTPFVFEHFLSDNIIVPGATYVEAGFHIGLEMLKMPTNLISVGFNFLKTYTPVKGRQSEIFVNMKSNPDQDSIELNIKSSERDLAIGSISRRERVEKHNVDIDYVKAICIYNRTKNECYDALGQLNFRYGERIGLIQQAWVSETGTECLAVIQIPDSIEADRIRTHFHPSVIDAVFQMFGIVVGESLKDAFTVPKGVDSVVINRPLVKNMLGYAKEVRKTNNASHYNAVLMTTNGIVIAEIENFYTRIITKDSNDMDNSAEYKLEWSEQEPSTEKQPEFDKIILLSDQPEKQWIHNLKAATRVIVKGSGDDWLPIDKEKERSLLLYHTPGSIGKTNMKNVYDGTLSRFLDMQKLLNSKVLTGTDIHIIIITENTQACPGRKHIEYVGSELWGMIRSAMHEGFFGRVRLIDIDPNELDISVFLHLISSHSTHTFEHAVIGSKVFQACMEFGTVGSTHRTISINPSDVLSLHSISKTCISKPYLSVDEHVTPEFGSTSVILEKFTVHDKSLYIPVIVDAIDSDNILQNDQDDQVISLEGRGKSRDTKQDVVFVYPVKVVTTVNVPNQHIFNLEECPFYQPGILILMNILVHISLIVKSGRKVAVIKQWDDTDIGEVVLKILMRKNKCNVRFYTKKDIQKSESIFEDETLILSTVSSVRYWSFIIKSFPHLKNVITLKSLLPDNLLQQIKHNYLHITIETISMSDIFNAKRILEAIPMIKSCMQEFSLNYHMSCRNKFLLNVPMKKFELLGDIENGSLKCLINAERLFRCNASYVIVGGLSGLGWELLQLMAAMGAKVLVTFSRRIPSDVILESLKALENDYNCHIVTLQVDICKIDSVQKAFRKLDLMFPNHPVRGIFHGAGVISDSILQTMDEEKVIKVMKPKIQGVWNLHVTSLNFALDYFVIHSSIVSVLGNPGQCNYAAANSFLDSFANFRRSLGLPGQSINWGALEIGMAAETDELKSKLKEKGFNLLRKERLRNYFIQTLERDTTSIVYADIVWRKLLSGPTFAMQSTKFNRFNKVRPNPNMFIPDKKVQFDLDDLNNQDDKRKIESVKGALKKIVCLVLVTEQNTLTDDTRLTDIGIDSMAAMSLSNAIDETFGYREAVVTLLSGETTIKTISKNILQSYQNPGLEEPIINMHSVNVSEFSYLFESKELTFMQSDLLETYKIERKNPFYVTVVDIEISDKTVSLSDLRLVFNHAMKLNPEFQKRYLISKDGEVTVETLPEGNSILNLKEISSEEFERSQDNDIREKRSFDIHNSLPISVEIAESQIKKMCRLTMHKVAFDMKGFTIFCTDMEKAYEAIINKKELPSERPVTNVASAVKMSILPMMQDLNSYWKSYLNRDISPVTFGPILEEPKLEFCRIENLNITSKTASRIRQYIAKHRISLYEFLMSIYQLYLYIGSGSILLTVGTAADMRFHVPELNNVITRCVNYIPTIANINEEHTITEFIKSNSIQLSKTTEHSAYPSSLIKNHIKTADMKENVYRHVLSMNDLTGIRGLSETKSMFKIRRILHSKPTRETFINVQTDFMNEWLNLELGYNSEICGALGKSFSNIMLSLMNMAMDGSEETLREIRDKWTLDNHYVTKKNGNMETTGLSYQKNSIKYHVIETRGSSLKDDKNLTVMNSISGNHTEDVERKGDADMGERKKSNDEPLKIKDILITGHFRKQTSYGWDHRVDARLIMDADDRIVLEWVKDRRIRKRTSRAFHLNNIQEIVMRKINDLHSVIIISNEKEIVLKTPDRLQAEKWIILIQQALISRENR